MRKIAVVRGMALGLAFGAMMLACLQAPNARAEVLITESEANLPAVPSIGMTTRGLTRGPGIEQLSPKPDQGVKSPLQLKIRFDSRNNVAIDPASIKLIYLKANPVDLTERIKNHITPNGIEMAKAEVPPGVHVLRLDLKDNQGRVGTAIIKLTVAGK